MEERVQKIIAASGYCSRRKAEELIAEGKVTVNGKKIKLGDKADPQKDKIMVGKREIIIKEHEYIMLHKPSNYLTTRSDLWGRRTVMELVKGINREIYPVGRLDRDARGLLIMTSDGEFAQKILHPRNEVTKTYQAIIDKPIKKEDMEKIRKGIIIDGRKVKGTIRKKSLKLIEITIHEGRNKIVKRIFKKLGYYVKDLKRVAIGKLRLDVPEGKWRRLTEKDKEKIFKKDPTHPSKDKHDKERQQKEHRNENKKNEKKQKNQKSLKKNQGKKKNAKQHQPKNA